MAKTCVKNGELFIAKDCDSKRDLPRFLGEAAEQKLPLWATAKESIRIRENKLHSRKGNSGRRGQDI